MNIKRQMKSTLICRKSLIRQISQTIHTVRLQYCENGKRAMNVEPLFLFLQ